MDATLTIDELTDLIRRVVAQKERVILHDAQGLAIAAVVPMEDLRVLEARATGEERLAELVAVAVAAEPDRLQRRTLPWEAVKANPAWQKQWDELQAEVRGRVPSELTAEEIEADLRIARQEVRQARRARRD